MNDLSQLSSLTPTIEAAAAKAVIAVTTPASKALAQQALGDVRGAAKRLDDIQKVLKRPHLDFLKQVDTIVKPLKALLDDRDSGLERALLTYKRTCDEATRMAQLKLNGQFEKKVAVTEAKAIAAGKPVPLVIPPPILAQSAKTELVGDSKQTTTGYWTWTGIVGVAGLPVVSNEDAESLTYARAQALGLDLPAEWFVLKRSFVTSCVKKQDRVPKCIISRFEEQIKVTG